MSRRCDCCDAVIQTVVPVKVGDLERETCTECSAFLQEVLNPGSKLFSDRLMALWKGTNGLKGQQVKIPLDEMIDVQVKKQRSDMKTTTIVEESHSLELQSSVSQESCVVNSDVRDAEVVSVQKDRKGIHDSAYFQTIHRCFQIKEKTQGGRRADFSSIIKGVNPTVVDLVVRSSENKQDFDVQVDILTKRGVSNAVNVATIIRTVYGFARSSKYLAWKTKYGHQYK